MECWDVCLHVGVGVGGVCVLCCRWEWVGCVYCAVGGSGWGVRVCIVQDSINLQF